MPTVREKLRAIRLIPPNDTLGWTPYAWLIYFPIFFVQPFLEGGIGSWLLCAGGTIVFLATYFCGYWVRGGRLLAIIATQTALGLAFTPINPGAYIFFVYAASFAAQLERTAQAVRCVIGITIAGLAAAWWFDMPYYYWIGHGVFTPFIAGINLHFARVNRANAKLHLAHAEIERLAAVAERERIARDLHDVLGHTLSLIVLKSELASKLADRDPARAAREIRDVEQVARTALSEVRDAIRGYRPTLSDELSRARTILDAARIDADVHVDVNRVPLGRGGEEVIALALREAVTNVVRHSGASHASIRVWQHDATALLEVHDDGRGGAADEGAGLRGMRERVESLGGRVSRAVDDGMRLTIALPLERLA